MLHVFTNQAHQIQFNLTNSQLNIDNHIYISCHPRVVILLITNINDVSYAFSFPSSCYVQKGWQLTPQKQFYNKPYTYKQINKYKQLLLLHLTTTWRTSGNIVKINLQVHQRICIFTLAVPGLQICLCLYQAPDGRILMFCLRLVSAQAFRSVQYARKTLHSSCNKFCLNSYGWKVLQNHTLRCIFYYQLTVVGSIEDSPNPGCLALLFISFPM